MGQLLTTAQKMSSFCVALALPVYADVSPNRDQPVSKPDYTGRASATQNDRDIPTATVNSAFCRNAFLLFVLLSD